MTENPHPLNRPLPPDVAAGEAAFIQFYQQYAVFSWPWAWRRAAIFGSIGALAGISFGASHGLMVRSVWEAIELALVGSAANLVLVGAGPMLAALSRHSGWPRRVERVGVVAAVICGMVLGMLSSQYAEHFHDRLMVAHGFDRSPDELLLVDVPSIVRYALDVSRDLLILFIASGGLGLPGYFSESRRWAEHRRRVEIEKLSQQKSEADLKLTLLQAQVEPHFLFNTLASVRSLVASDPQRASQTIDALARHLRATLPKMRAATGVAQSTLGEQFAICASYLDLMKVRLGERLRVDISLPAELQDVPFPPLLLISLVENAIKHGVEPKPGVTHVILGARVAEESGRKRLEVLVEDDGAGLKLGMGEGTGLANIRTQLLTRFASAASLELAERSAGGVLARLVLPLEAAIA
ncbi:MAG TPA: histidine kinase [Steroidobacteraceae bacterium]|jgi:two-component sensor histidine kinase|nr:histidine kinase [Steroidobacteraceae bacterium]